MATAILRATKALICGVSLVVAPRSEADGKGKDNRGELVAIDPALTLTGEIKEAHGEQTMVTTEEVVTQSQSTQKGVWSKNKHVDEAADLGTVDVKDGVATIQIPMEIFDEAELLWKSYVVGYFIGDAPHVGTIHATVNRIWSSPKAGSKIDVQFIEKNTVLFRIDIRIDDSQMRSRVLQRKYWHISDTPLVVNLWTPE